MKFLLVVSLFFTLLGCSTKPSYPSDWPQEAVAQGITESQIVFEFKYNDNCQLQFDVVEAQHGNMFAAIAENYKSTIISTSQKNYFFNDALKQEYFERVKEISPLWYKRLTAPKIPGVITAMSVAEEIEYPQIQALQQELIEGRSENIPAYQIVHILPAASVEPGSNEKSYRRVLQCSFDKHEKLMNSSLSNITDNDLNEIGTIEDLNTMDNRVALTLRVEN